jgi:hypothetical protein
MNEQENAAPAAGQPVYERCLCREAMEWWLDTFGIHSDAARQHLRNSRIEFLRAVRSIIDERIDHLSASEPPQGTKVTVE